MTGKIIHRPARPHECQIEYIAAEQRPGTVWQCDECGQKWVAVYGQGEDGKGYNAWRKLNSKNHTGEDLF